MALPTTSYDTATFDAVPNSGSESGFSLIVDLSKMSTEWWADVDTSDGTKGRAAKDSDETEYATDWIDFDDTAETGWMRFQVTASVSSGFAIRVYPPNTANSSNADSATYGSDNAYDANWEAYYPLDGGSIADRTSNDNDLTATNSPTDVTGQVGGGRSYNGTTQKDETTTATGLSSNSLTVMAWAKAPSSNSEAYFEISDGTSSNRILIYRGSAVGHVYVFFPSSNVVNDTGTVMSTSAWHHMAFTFNTTSNNHNSYYDGVQDNYSTTNVSDISGLDTISLADDQSGGFIGNPSLDDVQYHGTIRSEDWMLHEYNQTNDNPAFWNIGAGTWTNSGPAGGTFTPYYYTNLLASG